MKTNMTTNQKTLHSSPERNMSKFTGLETLSQFGLFEHQKIGVKFLIDNPLCVLADSMGLGKTKTAIVASGIVSQAGIMVVCPASLKINWQREINIVYPEDVVSIHGGNGEHVSRDASWTIINYDILNKNKDWILEEIKAGRIETIIFDEAHYIKDTKTIRTKASLEIALAAKRVYLLTGTPVMNRPIELFPLLRAVKHPLAWSTEKPILTLRKEFGIRYCGAYFHKLGMLGRGFWDEKGATRLPELRELTKAVFLRRTKAEVLDLPEKLVSVVSCPLEPNYKKAYERAWDNYLEWIANNPGQKDIGNILSAQAMIEIGKLKQVCSLAKVSRIVADIENAIDQGQKVIVFSQYTGTINAIAQALADKIIGHVTFTGADDMDQRQKKVDSFQNTSAIDVFIANMKAGGVGITLTAASIVIFADMEWSPTIHDQCADRAHRIGQTGTVNVYYYIADETIEEDIIDILTDKQETIGVLTDGETIIKPFMDRLVKRQEK